MRRGSVVVLVVFFEVEGRHLDASQNGAHAHALVDRWMEKEVVRACVCSRMAVADGLVNATTLVGDGMDCASGRF